MSMYPIASAYVATATSPGTTFVFTNIPQTFTHLQLRLFVRSASLSTSTNLYTNTYQSGSQSTTLASHSLIGNGSSASANGWTGLPYIFAGNIFPGLNSTSGVYANVIIDILDYTNTNKNKVMRILGGRDENGSGYVQLASGLSVTTNAANYLFVDTENGFTQYSRADLYGISTSSATGA